MLFRSLFRFSRVFLRRFRLRFFLTAEGAVWLKVYLFTDLTTLAAFFTCIAFFRFLARRFTDVARCAFAGDQAKVDFALVHINRFDANFYAIAQAISLATGFLEHCITETYAMVYECYQKMIELYGGGNVSTCGFSSGGALALGIAAHNNAQPEPLPQPRHIVAVSPGEVPWNDAERARMQALNKRDVSIDYAFMVTVEKFMRHGCENVPDYMLSGSRGDFTGVGDIHFFYSADEVLYGALPDFEEACKRANVPYAVSARPKMVHCYCMLPIFKEAKEDFAKIVDILKK